MMKINAPKSLIMWTVKLPFGFTGLYWRICAVASLFSIAAVICFSIAAVNDVSFNLVT